MPQSFLLVYQWLLVLSQPVFILIEGVTVLYSLISLGRFIKHRYEELSFRVFSFSLSGFVILAAISYCANLLTNQSISVLSACLLSCQLTLLVILIVAIVSLRPSNLMDLTIMSFYLSFNASLISFSWDKRIDPPFILKVASVPLSLLGLYQPLASILSGRFLFTCILRVISFVSAAYFFDFNNCDEFDEEPRTDLLRVLNCFGRTLLVLVCTACWQLSENTVREAMFRWINGFVMILLYGIYLVWTIFREEDYFI